MTTDLQSKLRMGQHVIFNFFFFNNFVLANGKTVLVNLNLFIFPYKVNAGNMEIHTPAAIENYSIVCIVSELGIPNTIWHFAIF